MDHIDQEQHDEVAQECPGIFAAYPTVCAVGHAYQIMVPVRSETLMWAETGGERFYDDSNGIMRSATTVHRMTVPAELLDSEKRYTIHWRKVINRLPYYTETEDEETATFRFRPVFPDATELRIYHLADTHSLIAEPIRAARYWQRQGETLDLLVMNGDMPEDCGTLEHIAAPYQVSGTVTRGEIPVVYARGNHDLRGILAEKYAELTPSFQGCTYYTWRVGPVWGVSLDCSEDKSDDHPAYGHTICCHAFRQRETRFLQELAMRGMAEYDAPDVKLKLVLCHVPFSEKLPEPFDIEEDTYRTWCKILKESIKPDLMLSGHNHQCYVTHPGGSKDHKGQPCPVVVGSRPERGTDIRHYTGAALHWQEHEGFEVFFTDDDGAARGKELIPAKGSPSLASHISFFYVPERIAYLEQVIQGLLTIPNHDIFIHTNQHFEHPLLSDHVRLIVHDLKDTHPFYLTWQSRSFFQQQLGQYDYYLYLEDDIYFTQNNFAYYLKYHPICKSQKMNLGFLRIEHSNVDGEWYLLDVVQPLTRQVTLDDVPFAVNKANPYCAMWILDNDELQRFVTLYPDIYQLKRPYYGNAPSMIRENAAISPGCSMYQMTLVHDDEGANLWHLTNNYVDHHDIFAKLKRSCLRMATSSSMVPAP